MQISVLKLFTSVDGAVHLKLNHFNFDNQFILYKIYSFEQNLYTLFLFLYLK